VNCRSRLPILVSLQPFFFLTFFLFALPLHASEPLKLERDSPNREIIRGINLLYDLEFGEAETLFQEIVSQDPENPVGYFYMAMVSWSKLSVGFWTPENLTEYVERIDRTISVAKKAIENNKKDSRSYFYLGGALGFKGRFELMQHNWFSSYNLAYEAIQALEKCHRMDPVNKDVLLGLGIYDYYTAKLSGVLRFLTYLFLHKGDKEEGLRKLHLAANEAVYSNLEAKSMLIHIYLYLEEDFYKALPLIKEMAGRFKNNSRYDFFEGVVYVRRGLDSRYREVLESMRRKGRQERSSPDQTLWENQALYLEASYHLFREQPEKARKKLDVILSQVDPAYDPAMVAWPILKKGMSYDLEGKRDAALSLYQHVLKMENGAGAQFLAEKCIDQAPKKGDPFLGY